MTGARNGSCEGHSRDRLPAQCPEGGALLDIGSQRGVKRSDGGPDDQDDPARARRRNPGGSADLDDAPGRPLPAGIPRHAREGRRLPVPLLHARPRGRGHAPADPALWLRCGDPLRRHPAGAAGAWRRSLVRTGRRAAVVHHQLPRRHGEAETRRGHPRHAGAGLRDGAHPCAGIAERRCADRFRRRALDRRDLHGRRARHARPGAGPCAHGRRQAGLRRPDRPPDRGHHRLPLGAGRGGGGSGQAVRQLGRIAEGPGFRRFRPRAGPADHRRPEGAPSRPAGHRLPA